MFFFFDEEDNVVLRFDVFWLIVLFFEFEGMGISLFGVDIVCLLLLNFCLLNGKEISNF